MKDLIEALQIFQRYQEDTKWPTHCEHDVLHIMGVEKDAPDVGERERLQALGFLWSDSDSCWISYRFGSA